LAVKYLVGAWEKDRTSSRIQADAFGHKVTIWIFKAW
jgi:hypothetical protein